MTGLTVRVAATVAGAALAAGLLAGCAGSGSPASSTAAPRTPRQAVAAAYTETVQAGSAKVTVSVHSAGGVRLTASGVADFADHRAALTVQVPQAGTVEVRQLAGTAYLQLPPSFAGALGATKPWISINENQAAKQRFGVSAQQLRAQVPDLNPATVLEYLRGAGQSVRDLGAATVDGVSTTHYSATIDMTKAAAGLPAHARDVFVQLSRQTGLSRAPVQVWVDEQGRVRRAQVGLDTTAGAAGETTTPSRSLSVIMTASDFGTPVHVVAPPADQTQDLTVQLSGAH